MKIIVDFSIYMDQSNFTDFQNAERFFLCNKGIVTQRLRKFTWNLANSDTKVGSSIFITNSGAIRYSPGIKALCFILHKYSSTEITYTLISVSKEANGSNQLPNAAGPEQTRLGSK